MAGRHAAGNGHQPNNGHGGGHGNHGGAHPGPHGPGSYESPAQRVHHNGLPRRYVLGGLALIVGSLCCAGRAILKNSTPPTPDNWTPNRTDQPAAAAPAPQNTQPAAPNVQLPPRHERLATSEDPQLRLLAAYEAKLGYGINSMMMLADMPKDSEAAVAQAQAMALRLKEWKAQGVKPRVMFQPVIEGAPADLVAMSDPSYNGEGGPLDDYFRTLNWQGVTAEDMGEWVLFPQPNIPVWNNGETDPNLFRANLTAAAQRLKTHFSDAKVSVMLDSTSTPSTDYDYQAATTDPAVLLQYVSGIPEGLVDSFGLQGLAWNPTDDPATYLSAQSAVQCATRLGVKDIWFNTGTNSSNGATTEQRAIQLGGAFLQGAAAQGQGFTVQTNLYAANENNTNWAYTTSPDAFGLFSEAMQGATAANMSPGFYDDPRTAVVAAF